MKKFTQHIITESKSNDISSIIDYTNLKSSLSIDQLKEICDTAIENKYYSVCILPEFVSVVSSLLDDSDVKPITVVSFPQGDNTTKQKVVETNNCIVSGAKEIDMVLDYKKLISLDKIDSEEDYKDEYDDLIQDVRSVASVCHKNGVILKVIIETGALTFEQISKACDICENAGADFVKTSTGFFKNEDSLDVKLQKVKFIKSTIPDYINIKVSGGIRSIDDARKFEPYVDRIGTSNNI